MSMWTINMKKMVLDLTGVNHETLKNHHRLTLQLPKNVPGVVSDSNGCPVSDVFLYDPSTGSWTTNAVTIISSAYNGTTNACDVIVQAPHYSQFALGAPAVAAPAPAPAPISVGYSAGGAGAGGPSPSPVVSSGGGARRALL